MTRKYEYNKANLITGVTNINNKNVKTSYGYSYYPDGNIAHYVNHYNATMDYTYDSANRVVKEVYGEDANMPFTIGYTYDEFGNLTKKDYGDADNPSYITTYSYDKNNRWIKENQVVSNGNAKWQNITSYGYDKNGNRLNRVEYKNKNVDSNKFNLGMIDVGSNSKGTGYKYSDYGKEVYTYDGLNELKSYRGKDEQNATYEYMPNHYRISKTVDGTKTYQLWDNDRVVSEFDSELNMKINYRIGTNGQVLSDSKENLYSYDGHGNLVNGKDNSSTTVYDAYGNKTEDIGIGDAPFGYCGEYTDSESGFVYLRNRYYDPSTGSFITEDPIKDGNNWYGYASQNPVMFGDSSGLTTTRGGNFFEGISKIISSNKKLSKIIKFTDFRSHKQDDDTTVWYTNSDCWQKAFGYNNIYDKLADNSGPSILGINKMDVNVNLFNIITKKFYFNFNEVDYRIQLWKGRYGPGIGCEVGIYEKKNGSYVIENALDVKHYKSSSVDYKMSIQLRDSSNNTQIFSRKDNTWWINGFIANNASLDDLTMDISITFPDSHMAEIFTGTVNKARESYENRGITVNRNNNEVNVTWASKNFTDANYGK